MRVTFQCTQLDECGWVVDFGGLKRVREWLDYTYDHTVLVDAQDPELPAWQALHERGALDLRIVPCVSMEGSARYVHEHVDPIVRTMTNNRCWICRVECFENEKNSAIYVPCLPITNSGSPTNTATAQGDPAR